MIIRDAGERDASPIRDIRLDIVRDPVITFTTHEPDIAEVQADIKSAFDDGRAFLVAEKGGQVIGYATWNEFRKGPGYRFTAEHSVYVRAGHKGEGVGGALMTALLDRAAASGLKMMVAGISAENREGLDFHKRLGFQEVGRMPGVGFKGNRFLDLVLMQIALGADTSAKGE